MPVAPARLTGGTASGSSVAGSGAAARFTPMPITSVPPAPVSSRMPASLRPPSSTSFGHLSAKSAGRPVTATIASKSPSAATNERSAGGAPSGRIKSVAPKLPSGAVQGRPRRPRAALCRRARIQTGPAAPAAARRSASALVLSSAAKTSRPTPAGQSAIRYCTSVAAAAPASASTPKRLTTPSTIASAATPSSAKCSAGIWPSSGSEASPKYMR